MKFRTKAACRIARIDPQRFNEDVASGDYPHAPKTRSGVSRVFDEADIAGLLIYRHLMDIFGDRGFTKKTAAMYAGGIIQALRAPTTTDRSRVDFPINGFNDDGVPCNKDEPPYFGNERNRALAATMSFDLEHILKVVRQGMAEEAQVLGEED
ncbi:hypothetical protein [Pseudaestuariivita rosea]|uniref:hypothetical protein n=1 Tax=Pseudaestuariivita rosea TaxID=2763263 RepID=UPI001ABBBE2A|nr:hypothetical protein [Pseudaestuariivita rosea]